MGCAHDNDIQFTCRVIIDQCTLNFRACSDAQDCGFGTSAYEKQHSLTQDYGKDELSLVFLVSCSQRQHNIDWFCMGSEGHTYRAPGDVLAALLLVS